VAANVPVQAPGRGLTQERLHFQTAVPRLDGTPRADDLGDATAGGGGGGCQRLAGPKGAGDKGAAGARLAIQLAGDSDEMVARHKLLTGPRCDGESIGKVHSFVHALHTDRHDVAGPHQRPHL